MRRITLLSLLLVALTTLAQNAPDWYEIHSRRQAYPDEQFFTGFAEGQQLSTERAEAATQRIKDAARVEAVSTVRVHVLNTTTNKALSQTIRTMDGTLRESTREFTSTTQTSVNVEIPGLQIESWTNPTNGSIAAFAYVKRTTLIRLLQKKIIVSVTQIESSLDRIDQLIASGQKMQARELAEQVMQQLLDLDETQKILAAVDPDADEESLQLQETRILHQRLMQVIADQTKVAVYVTGHESVSETAKQVVGGELVAGIVANSEYSAVERTAEFLEQIAKEHKYQRSGNVDDRQIQALGKQFGVQIVCAANIMPHGEQCYIQVRMIDVETATVMATERELSSLTDLQQLMAASEKLAGRLVGEQREQVTYDEEFSSVLSSSTNDCGIMSIDNTGSATVVQCKYLAKWKATIRISPDAYILDRDTDKRYRINGANGISTTKKTIVTSLLTPFTLYFDKLPQGVTHIDIIDPAKKGWRWEGIILRPYGKPDYYVFEDNIEPQYQTVLKFQQEME